MKIPVLRAALAAGLVVGMSCGFGGRAAAGLAAPGRSRAPGEFVFYRWRSASLQPSAKRRGGKTSNAPMGPMRRIAQSR